MFGNVTALEGLHVIREIQELEYDARMLQARRLVLSQGVGYLPLGEAHARGSSAETRRRMERSALEVQHC